MQVSISTPFNIALNFELASLNKRGLAYLIDLAVKLVFAIGMRSFLRSILLQGGLYSTGTDVLLVSLPMLFYPLISEVMFNGQSIGKYIMGLRVISLEGREPRLGQYLMRWIFRLWEAPLFFGFLSNDVFGLTAQLFSTLALALVVMVIIAVNSKNQRLGDLAAGTVLVDLKQRFSLSDTLFSEVDRENYQVLFPDVMRLSDRDINAIKSVLIQLRKRENFLLANKVAQKIKTALNIQSNLSDEEFLEKLLQDYNYIATRE